MTALRSSLVLPAVRTVLGAAMLGVGTVLQPKARADHHWSVSPKVVLAVRAGRERSGDPVRGGLPGVRRWLRARRLPLGTGHEQEAP